MITIRKTIPYGSFTLAGAAPDGWQGNAQIPTAPASTIGNFLGWKQITHASYGNMSAFYWQDTIDINGLTTLQDKALMPTHIDVHQGAVYQAGGTAATEPDNYLVEWIVLTTVPWDVDAWASGMINTYLPYRIPGVTHLTNPATIEALSADQTLYGRVRYLQNDIETFDRVAVVKGEEFFGTLGPTMSDELYVTRILSWNGAAVIGATINTPSIELNIDAYAGELSELEQIMEMRRSYLTQQTVA
jgi:hypothetical protein